FFQAEDGIRDPLVTGVQTCALPIFSSASRPPLSGRCVTSNPPFASHDAAPVCLRRLYPLIRVTRLTIGRPRPRPRSQTEKDRPSAAPPSSGRPPRARSVMPSSHFPGVVPHVASSALATTAHATR